MFTLTKEIQEQVMRTFDFLHKNPEISWKEKKTTAYIADLLKEAGCVVKTFEDCTGVIGDYGNFENGKPIIGIRADMDALWQEVDGEFKGNHSCGHDAHMAIVLGVLWKLKEIPASEQEVAVRFIFQPAEELGQGALKMVEKGVVDEVDYLFGIHLRPKQEMQSGFASPSIIHGATASYELQIDGDDAHGARPHLNNNAIEIGAHILQALKGIYLDPQIPHSVKVTKFIAGGKNTNIIPGKASLGIDLRAQTNGAMEHLQAKVKKVFEATEQLFATTISITNTDHIVAAEVHPEAEAIAAESIAAVRGSDKLTPPLLTPGGDDFHFYTIKKPSLKATMVGLGCGLSPGLHHPKMTFDHHTMHHGSDVLLDTILRASEKGERLNG